MVTGSHNKKKPRDSTRSSEQTLPATMPPGHDDEATADGLDSGEHEVDEDEGAGDDSTGERDYPVPEGWDYDDMTNEEFWTKIYALEHAQEESPDGFKMALRIEGFVSEGHFSWVKERFLEKHGGDTNFPQSMMNARQAHNRAQLRQAVGAELLEPIEDVTLERYATIQVRLGALPQKTPQLIAAMLAEYELDMKSWIRIDKAWKTRLTDPANAVAAASVNSEYRKHVTAVTKRLNAGAKARS